VRGGLSRNVGSFKINVRGKKGVIAEQYAGEVERGPVRERVLWRSREGTDGTR